MTNEQVICTHGTLAPEHCRFCTPPVSVEEQLTKTCMRLLPSSFLIDGRGKDACHVTRHGNLTITSGSGAIDGLTYELHLLPAGELERLRKRADAGDEYIRLTDPPFAQLVAASDLIAEIKEVVRSNDDKTVQHCGCCTAIDDAIARYESEEK